MIASLAQTELPSYRDLPKVVYQIQWKFRDEPRPRGGLLRGREFYMKDAYCFDADEAGLMRSYKKMEAAYRVTFERLGLTAVPIEADPGAIGGTVNHEFTQPCSSGEDTFVSCDSCDYATNTEVATGVTDPYEFGDAPFEDIATPGLTTVAEVANLLDVEPRRILKALVYKTQEGTVCVLVPGDRELNEFKLAKLVGDHRMLTDDEMSDEVWYPVGPNDIFPEEFATFLLTDPDVRADFLRVNADLLDAQWWQRMQQQAGELPPEVLSYPEPLRFIHGSGERAPAGSTPVGATDSTLR